MRIRDYETTFSDSSKREDLFFHANSKTNPERSLVRLAGHLGATYLECSSICTSRGKLWLLVVWVNRKSTTYPNDSFRAGCQRRNSQKSKWSMKGFSDPSKRSAPQTNRSDNGISCAAA